MRDVAGVRAGRRARGLRAAWLQLRLLRVLRRVLRARGRAHRICGASRSAHSRVGRVVRGGHRRQHAGESRRRASIRGATNGRPMMMRDKVPAEAEMFGLKIRQLVSPVFPNEFPPFQRVGANRKRRRNFRTKRRTGRRGSASRARSDSSDCSRCCSCQTRPRVTRHVAHAGCEGREPADDCGLLLATVGGFGSLFSLFISADIRAYNRHLSVHRVLLAAGDRAGDRRAVQDAPRAGRRRVRRARDRPCRSGAGGAGTSR